MAEWALNPAGVLWGTWEHTPQQALYCIRSKAPRPVLAYCGWHLTNVKFPSLDPIPSTGRREGNMECLFFETQEPGIPSTPGYFLERQITPQAPLDGNLVALPLGEQQV